MHPIHRTESSTPTDTVLPDARELGDHDRRFACLKWPASVLAHKRYQVLSERLRQAGFGPDTNDKGNPTRQRWRIDGPPKVAVDFLIPPSRSEDRGGDLRDIEADFAAIIAPGLRLAFMDRC